MATLILELSLTRIFSVVFYYHFAFLAISIALFGLGAGGVFSYVAAGWKSPFYTKLGTLAAINSIAVLVSLVFLITRRGDSGNVMLGLIYFASALPFFFAGTIVSLVVSETIARIDRVYFFDLLGAAGGCLLLVPLLEHPRRPEYRARRCGALRGFRGHLVQPGRRATRAGDRRGAGAGVRRADRIQCAWLLDRHPLCQGPAPSAGAV